MKYTWEANKNAEIWRNGICETISECIAEAKQEGHKVIYVAEAIEYHETLQVDAEYVLCELENYATSNCGEVAEDWCPSYQDESAIDELSASLTKCVKKWLEKHNETPHFYSIKNAREIVISDDGYDWEKLLKEPHGTD